jgi:5-methylcytosine-specific restriction protein A
MGLKALPPRLGMARQAIAAVPKITDPHYLTAEHRAWRDEVLRRAGGRCQWPGCGSSSGRMFADHIRERKDGGDPLDPANGQCLCARHHNLKTAQERARRLSTPTKWAT